MRRDPRREWCRGSRRGGIRRGLRPSDTRSRRANGHTQQRKRGALQSTLPGAEASRAGWRPESRAGDSCSLQHGTITLLLAPVAQQRGGARIFGVVGDDHAAFAGRAEVLGWIKAEAADIADAPARRPLYSAPWACAASSITIRLWRRAMSRIGSMSARWPYRCTGRMARVRGGDGGFDRWRRC